MAAVLSNLEKKINARSPQDTQVELQQILQSSGEELSKIPEGIDVFSVLISIFYVEGLINVDHANELSRGVVKDTAQGRTIRELLNSDE
jgi:hypothetical protein